MVLEELQGKFPVHIPATPVAGTPTDNEISMVVVVRQPTPIKFHFKAGATVGTGCDVLVGTGWEVFVTDTVATGKVTVSVSTEPDV
jgi:hypothetical protein